jgi:hypothetical protein
VLKTLNGAETMGNMEHKTEKDRMGQCVYIRFHKLVDKQFLLETYCMRVVSCCMWILGHKQKYSMWNEPFRNIYTSWSNDSNPCKNILGLGIATWPCLSPFGRQSKCSNNYVYSNWREQTLNRQYIEMKVNRVSIILGQVSQGIQMVFACGYV